MKNLKRIFEVIVFSNGINAKHTVKAENRTDIPAMFEGCKVRILSEIKPKNQ